MEHGVKRVPRFIVLNPHTHNPRLIHRSTKWLVESCEVNEVQQRRGFPWKKSGYPLYAAEIQNEVHMRITKHNSNRRVSECGHTSGPSWIRQWNCSLDSTVHDVAKEDPYVRERLDCM